MMVLWAHVVVDDRNNGADFGKIEKQGVSPSDDVFRQQMESGLMCVARPEHVSCFEDWRFIDGEWILAE